MLGPESAGQAHRVRWARVEGDFLVAQDDALRACGISQDPAHDWAHWAKSAFEAAIQASEAQTLAEIELPEVEEDSTRESTRIWENNAKMLLVLYEGSPNLVRSVNYAGFQLLLKIYVEHGRMPTEKLQTALDCFHRIQVGDRRIVEEVEANASAVSAQAAEFVLGSEEAERQRAVRVKRKAPGQDALQALHATIEDDSISMEVAKLRFGKVKELHVQTEAAKHEIAAFKKVKAAETKKQLTEIHLELTKKEAEAKAEIAKREAEAGAAVAQRDLERERAQSQRARVAAERAAIEHEARSAAQERLHREQLAAERRRKEVADAVAAGAIEASAAERLLDVQRLTLIRGLESWLGKHRRCETPSRCSSELGKRMKAAIDEQRHLKPQSHWDRELQRWNYYEEHDAAMLAQLHQQLHEQQRRLLGRSSGNGNGNSVVVGPGQQQQRRFLVVGGRVGFPNFETIAKETAESSAAAVSSTTVSSATEASAAVSSTASAAQ
jgi:hypothetical protein